MSTRGRAAIAQPTAGKLADNLEAQGIAPAQVTKVIFTHGHADHLWGAIDDFDDSERFADATYVMFGAGVGRLIGDPDTPSRTPDWLKGMARASARILKRLEHKMERRGNGEAIAAGLSYVETFGHTPGHMSVMVEGSPRAPAHRRGRALPRSGFVRAAGLALGQRLRQRSGGRPRERACSMRLRATAFR